MANESGPYIAAERNLPEITLRVIVLSIFLATILALANCYLALKIGMLTSASIPAAVISMGILRFFKDANILENNLVQTAASAGEAVAGGIVYTIPALIIVGYWQGFDYWDNLFIALLGGFLGVMFSIPLRRLLVKEPSLKFPEGRAIAEVLKISSSKASGFTQLIWGGVIGAVIELGQTGFKIFANSWQAWFMGGRSIYGFGAGFSPAMIGAGFLVGFPMCLSIMIGAVLGWLLSVPVVSQFYPQYVQGEASHAVQLLWGDTIRYLGIGAMLSAGVLTFFSLMKPFYQSIKTSLRAMQLLKQEGAAVLRTEKDIPLKWIVFATLLCAVALYALFWHLFPLSDLGLTGGSQSILMASLFYILLFGFVFCAITAYFSGMVGVTASPGSAIIIGGMLIAGVSLFAFMKWHHAGSFSQQQLLAAEAITIILGAIITGAAAISNDNIQDLKVGHILGATPWKQELMLILGVCVSAAVIPPIMQLLFNVYGIAGVMPHAGMDVSQALPAPPAAVMAALTNAMFHQSMPWNMMLAGIVLVVIFSLLNVLLKRNQLALSILGVAIGVYLPLSSSTPLFIGGVFSLLAKRNAASSDLSDEDKKIFLHRGVLIACGLVAGAALMDVLLAIPFSLLHSPDSLRIVSVSWSSMAIILSLIVTLLLGRWFIKITA